MTHADPSEALEALALGAEPSLTRAQVEQASGIPDPLARMLWRALGFPDVAGAAAFTEADVEALRIVRSLLDRGLVDEDTAVVLARGLGQTTARLADWQVEALGRFFVESHGLQGRDLASDADAFATVERTTAELIPDLQALLGYAWRRQLAAVLERRLARTDEMAVGAQVSATVGFADLVGFTRLSRQLEDADLATLVERFESVSADVVAATGAELVKTVGDEVLFVAESAEQAAEASMRLHEAHAREPEVPEMRIGLATGPVLRRMGDVFGSTVNLASRITALARPGATLVDAATARQVSESPGFRLRQMAPRRIRGVGVIRSFALLRTDGDEAS